MRKTEEIIGLTLILLLLSILICASIYTFNFDLGRKASDNLYVNLWKSNKIGLIWIISLQLSIIFGFLNAILQISRKNFVTYIWVGISLLSLILLLLNY